MMQRPIEAMLLIQDMQRVHSIYISGHSIFDHAFNQHLYASPTNTPLTSLSFVEELHLTINFSSESCYFIKVKLRSRFFFSWALVLFLIRLAWGISYIFPKVPTYFIFTILYLIIFNL